MRRTLIFVAASLFLVAAPGHACDDEGNVMQSPLALPSDMALNMTPAGDVFVVALDDCTAPVYALVFPRKLEAAKAGDAAAMDAVGLMFAAGSGVDQDWEEARNWLEKAAAGGAATAHFRLGVMYQLALGVEADPEAAVAHYRTASDAGVAWATTNLAVAHLQGIGVRANVREAIRLFKLARQQGDPTATYSLAALYAEGSATGGPDYAAAYPLAREAALAQNREGMRLLGYFFATGRGTEASLESAYVWTFLAAERGDTVGKQLNDRIKRSLSADALASAQSVASQCAESDFAECP